MSMREYHGRCRLCNASGRLTPAQFHQSYKQIGRPPLALAWWDCAACRGWFVHPVPTPAEIESHCNLANYNDPAQASGIARAKDRLHRRLLSRLAGETVPGPLLDVGCSFGEFMRQAHNEGWTPSGFEPHAPAAAAVRAKGFDVRCEWELEKAEFPEAHFAAVTAIDSFCFVWNPHQTLVSIHRLLRPHGILAMRISNKHAVARIVRAMFRPGSARDAHLTSLMKGQFHSITAGSLAHVLRGIGFDRIAIEPSATTAEWSSLSLGTRMAYSLSHACYVSSLGRINLSPGVLLFARKRATNALR